MPHVRKEIVLIKTSVISLNADVASGQLVEMSRKAIGTTLARRGWTVRKPSLHVSGEPGKYTNTATVSVHRTGERDRDFAATTEKQWQDIHRKFLRAGRSLGWHSPAKEKVEASTWRCSDCGIENDLNAFMCQACAKVAFATPPGTKDFAGAESIKIPDNWRSFFDHIYDREDQISEVLASIRTAQETAMEVRNHLMLYGSPGCGKSEIGLALERMLGDNCVLRLDATSTTKAGGENLILERETLPPILILEELEKCNEANVPWLLGVMDDRGEIVKTTARVGSVRRKAPMLVICTVNNLKKLTEFQEGALVSRFNVPLYFPMPDRGLLRRILLREVKKIPGGNIDWVEPALEFALNVERTYQARRIKAIMTNARDRLLDGSYQASRTRMMTRRDEDNETLKQFETNG